MAGPTVMTDGDKLQLPVLGRALQDTFPARDDAPLALALLRLLAGGQPVYVAALASATARDERAARSRLEVWPNVERNGDGAVIAFLGLTLRQSAHSFSVDGRRLHTWCAWDTLFLPALLDATATVGSTCAVTGAPVQLVVSPGGVERARPDELHVSFPPLAATRVSDITNSFCCHVHFLAGADATAAWQREHPDGYALDLDAAFELGQRAVAPLLGGDAALGYPAEVSG
jgi:alkylmercury lyase